MSVVTKALELLKYFSASRPEIGLSHFCKLTKRDKATTYRYLEALEEAGFVEKNRLTRAYRIGPMVLHLAQMRELTVPRREGARHALENLAEATGETAHASVLSGTDLHALLERQSNKHSTRAVIDIQVLPLHATASGICALAFGPEDLLESTDGNLKQFTPYTADTKQRLSSAIDGARKTGFGISNRGLEFDVYGMATPVFDKTGLLAGTVAVASVASRVTPETQINIKQQLIDASREITTNWGGAIPVPVEECWARSMEHADQQKAV